MIFEVVTTMEAFLSSLTTFFSQALNWMGDVLDVVVQSPVLLVVVIAMPVTGFAVGLLRRLIRL